jgi:hypothetical protein
MAYNPRKYFPPAYFAGSFWGTGGGELPPGFVRGSSFGVATVTGLIYATGALTGSASGFATVTGELTAGNPNSMQGSAQGTSTATGTLTYTGTPIVNETIGPLGNLGFDYSWPEDAVWPKRKKAARVKSIYGSAHGSSVAKGRLTARNITKEKQLVRDIIERYEHGVAQALEEDDEEILAMMF